MTSVIAVAICRHPKPMAMFNIPAREALSPMARSEARESWDRTARANLQRFLEELEATKHRPEFKAEATEQLISEVKRRIADLDARLPH